MPWLVSGPLGNAFDSHSNAISSSVFSCSDKIPLLRLRKLFVKVKEKLIVIVDSSWWIVPIIVCFITQEEISYIGFFCLAVLLLGNPNHTTRSQGA